MFYIGELKCYHRRITKKSDFLFNLVKTYHSTNEEEVVALRWLSL